jgi:pimeloyl-ACP methyl ester carboxylesterase
MNFITSRDGTKIAYERSGDGPSLVLAHGTATDHSYWAPVVRELERHFTVCAIDRRGRGHSGDTEPYAIEREFDDLATLIESIDEPVNLLGHSYGALCSLEAAQLAANVGKLALYEPPIYTTVDIAFPTDIVDRFDALLRAGSAEQALVMLYELDGTSTAELQQLRAMPNWHARVLAAHTIHREQTGARGYTVDRNRLAHLTVPTLLLVGGESTPFYKAAIETLHRSLPHSRITCLPNQRHEAVITAPALFQREIMDFLLGDM